MASMRGPIYNPAGGSCTLGLSASGDPGLRGCSSVYVLAAVMLYACSSIEAGYWQGYLVYRVEARPVPANNYPLHPGQPVEVWPAE